MILELALIKINTDWIGVMGSERGLYCLTLPVPDILLAMDSVILKALSHVPKGKFHGTHEDQLLFIKDRDGSRYYHFRMSFLPSAPQLRKLILNMDRKNVGKELSFSISEFKPAYSMSEVRSALLAYFNGNQVQFVFPLDLEGYSNFQTSVWETAQSIPYGELRSYGWIADQIEKPNSARAVGQALGQNPLPIIIPCHRVVRADGTLGGFSGGLHWKSKLIRLEGAIGYIKNFGNTRKGDS